MMLTFRTGKLAALMVSVVVLGACSREQQDWRSAEASDTVDGYSEFLHRHPDSELATEARTRVAQLSEDKEWQTAGAADTAEAYKQFLVEHPNGKWAQEARIRMENFALGREGTAGAPGAGVSVVGDRAGAGAARAPGPAFGSAFASAPVAQVASSAPVSPGELARPLSSARVPPSGTAQVASSAPVSPGELARPLSSARVPPSGTAQVASSAPVSPGELARPLSSARVPPSGTAQVASSAPVSPGELARPLSSALLPPSGTGQAATPATAQAQVSAAYPARPQAFAQALPNATTSGPTGTAPSPSGSAQPSPAIGAAWRSDDGFGVQLGAFASENAATTEWQQLTARFAAQLRGLSPRVVSASTATGRLFRLQALVADEAAARTLCDMLKKQSQACVPVLPH